MVFSIQGCTVLNTPIKQEWYQTNAKYTSITLRRSDIQKIHGGKDLDKFSYLGDKALYLLYEKTISGGDAAVYYGNPGNYLGFVYGAGTNKQELNKKIDILKNFILWANLTKQQRLNTEGILVELYGDEYINFEHRDGPIMMVRVTGSYFYCTLIKFCYAAFVNPSSAEIMVHELSKIRDKKFRS